MACYRLNDRRLVSFRFGRGRGTKRGTLIRDLGGNSLV